MHGVQVVRDEGLGGLSARRLAQQAGSSVAPIYRSFKSMDELTVAVLPANQCHGTRIHASPPHRATFFSTSEWVFAIFARDEKALFRALHFENNGAPAPGRRAVRRDEDLNAERPTFC